MFHSIIKLSLKRTRIYAADLQSRCHFQDKKYWQDKSYGNVMARTRFFSKFEKIWHLEQCQIDNHLSNQTYLSCRICPTVFANILDATDTVNSTDVWLTVNVGISTHLRVNK